MSKSKGFTLIELMIVVAIIGIIAAVAYPSYQEQVNKSRRGDCTGALVGLSNAMERFYTVNSTYLGAGASGANTGAPAAALFSATCPVDGGTPVYNLTIAAATASTYTLRATPTGAQAGDRCGTFTLTNTGAKNVTGADSGVDWQACW
ncbi:MAG: type IV pilin protein [Woeseiaceae bacterium]|nr:type IV pilin protein [Woeseiaceae bacterium]